MFSRLDLPCPVLLHRLDPSRNMARFYRLSLEANLFGGLSLVIEWGRVGKAGRRRQRLFDGQDAALASWTRIEAAKRRRGYKTV
jgi:predicted DNA-binding WGR domain protein